MLLSLQRRQQQEEAKARKEAEAQARREAEKFKEEEKVRKKEEQAARRQAILEQYKMKKAIEEAEREVSFPFKINTSVNIITFRANVQKYCFLSLAIDLPQSSYPPYP